VKLQHVRSLDGVRGVAVVLIVVHHIVVRAPDPSYSGWAAVDLFFALSGFLITQSILTSAGRGTGGVRLREFYRRRFWRLAPALAVFLVVSIVLWPEDPNPKATLASAAQVLNVVQGFGEPPFSPHLGHLWSISAEVQFYVVWALALFVLVRVRAPRWVIVGVLLAAFAASAVIRAAIVADGEFVWNRPYFSPDTRGAALATGCIVGLAFAWGWLHGLAVRRALAVLTVPAVVVFWWATTVHHLDARLYTTALPLVAIAVAALVGAAATSAPSPIRRAFELEPFPSLGRISYSLYLWHLPILEEVDSWRGSDDLVGIAMVGIPLSLAAGVASFVLVERPLLRGVPRKRVPTAA
jgi:peptidoglycan/LPS O-acetylase OafA/YrhL